MSAEERLRVDKWLWVARLLKTRALAADAVKTGRVKVNGVAAQPSKEVGAGDRLELRTGPVRLDVLVHAAAPRSSAGWHARTGARAGARPSASAGGSRRSGASAGARRREASGPGRRI